MTSPAHSDTTVQGPPLHAWVRRLQGGLGLHNEDTARAQTSWPFWLVFD